MTKPGKNLSAIGRARVEGAIGNRYNPIRSLTPEVLGMQIDQFKSGRLRALALVMDAVEERDCTIKTVVAKRKKSVSRLPWEVLTIEGAEESRAARHKDALERFYNQVVATDVLNQNQRGGLSLLIRQLMDAQGKGFAVHEIIWTPQTAESGGLRAVCQFCPLWWFENMSGRLRYLESDGSYQGADLESGGWLVAVGDGLMLATVIAYVFKLFPLRDWLSFCEKFGLPGVLGSTDASPGSAEWQDMEKAVESLINDWAAVKKTGDKIELLEASAASNLPFLPLVEYMDRKIAALWRGADLSTISQGKEGSGASLQGDETELLLEDDAAWVEETLHEGLSKAVIQYETGDTQPLAYLKLQPPKKRQVDADDKAVRLCLDAGIPLGVDSTRERLGFPKPDEDEETLGGVSEGTDGTNTAKMPQDDPDGLEGINTAPKGQKFKLKAVKGLSAGFTNEVSQRYLAAARDQFGRALAADLAPLRRRLVAIEGISDPEIRKARLEALLAEWDSLAGDITADPEAAQALARIQGTAMAEGLTSEFRNVEGQGHPFRGNQHQGGIAGDVRKINQVLDGKADEAVLSKVTPEVAAQIKQATNRDVSGYNHFVDRDALVHIDRQHGVGKEDQPGHEPVTRDDIERIPEITAAPDRVIDGGKTARGLPSVKYVKRYNGTTYYVEEEWAKEGLLAAKTMYKMTRAGE